MRKLQRQDGESLVEVLLSMLIISLGMLILAGAITSAARLNATARRMSARALTPMDDANRKVTVTLNGRPLKTGLPVTVVQLEDGTELYFYG